MIGMIEPLVQAARDPRDAVRSIAVYALGVLSTAALAGAGWALVALAAQRLTRPPAALLILAVACAALALADAGVRGATPPSIPRQTCSLWWRRFGPLRAWFYWGLDLGLGVTTYRATSLYWAAFLTAVLVIRPATAPLVALAYGLGLVANLSLGALALRWTGLFGQAGSPSVLFLRPARLASAGVLACWSLAMIGMAL
jgi:hypothetical protein